MIKRTETKKAKAKLMSRRAARQAAVIALSLMLTLVFFAAFGVCRAEQLDNYDYDDRNNETQQNEREGEHIRSEVEEELRRLSPQTDLSAWQRYFDELRTLASMEAEYADVNSFVEEIAFNGADVKLESVYDILKALFVPTVKTALSRLAGVAALALVTGLMGIIIEKHGGTHKLIMLFLCAAAILGITAVFSEMAAGAVRAVNDVGKFCEIAAPILGTLLTAMGCESSARLLSPKLAFLAGGLSAFVRGVIMPLLLASGVMTVLNGFTERLKLERAVKLIHKTAKWLLGLAATVYTAVSAVCGIAAAAADGVAIRTAKYAIDKLTPAGGGLMAGAVDAVSAGALIMKNSVGIAAIVLAAAVVIRPLVSLLAGMFAMRLTAAVCEPFSDERIPKMLDGIAETTSFMLACAAAVAGMFVITVIMMMAAGSAVTA